MTDHDEGNEMTEAITGIELAPINETGEPIQSWLDCERAPIGAQFHREFRDGLGGARYVKVGDDLWQRWEGSSLRNTGSWEYMMRNHLVTREPGSYRWDRRTPEALTTPLPPDRNGRPVQSWDEVIQAPIGAQFHREDRPHLRYRKVGQDVWWRWMGMSAPSTGTWEQMRSRHMSTADPSSYIWDRYTPQEEATQETVRVALYQQVTRELLDQLPDGTLLRFNRNALATNRDRVLSNLGASGSRSRKTDGTWSTTIHDSELDNWFVAELPVTVEQMGTLPQGARVHATGMACRASCRPEGQHDGVWVKRDDDTGTCWASLADEGGGRGSNGHSNTLFRGATIRLVEMPEGAEQTFEIPTGEAPRFRTGMVVTLQDMDDLPAGSVLRHRSRVELVTKGTAGLWRSSIGDCNCPTNDQVDAGEWVLQTIGQEEVTMQEEAVQAPAQQPVPELNRRSMQEARIGSSIRFRENPYTVFVKVSPDRWQREDRETQSYRADDFLFSNYEWVTYLPPLSQAVLEAIDQVKTEVRTAIDACVRQQGYWGWVRDGAFMLLGVNPIPAVDTDIEFGAAFGLPVGSVVRAHNRLWEVVNNDDMYPQLLRGSRMNPRIGDRDEAQARARVLILGTHTEPSYTGRNDFLHKLWEKERQLRGRNSWCNAVESCLIQYGLTDPGDVPDEPEQPVVAPVVGDVVRVDEDGQRIDLLPDGTTFTIRGTDRLAVKATGRVLHVDSLNRVRENARLIVTTVPEAAPQPF